jgi:hypothetical protein
MALHRQWKSMAVGFEYIIGVARIEIEKTRLTRSSRRPLRSKASIVLAQVGAAAASVMAAISALCSAIALRKPGG